MYTTKDAVINYYESSFKTRLEYKLYSTSIPLFMFNDVKKTYDNIEELKKEYPKYNERFNRAVETDEEILSKREKELYENSNYSYHLKSSIEDAEKIIEPIRSLKTDVLVFLISSLLVGIIIIVFSFSSLSYKKIRNNAIKISLGNTRTKVMFESLINNVIISSLSILCAYLVYTLTISNIINIIFKDSIHLQNNLMRIVSGEVDVFKSYNNLVLDFNVINISYIVYILIFIAFILVVVILTIIIFEIVQPKNIKKALIKE